MKFEVRSSKFEVRRALARRMAVGLVALVLPVTLLAQQRDTPVAPVGTGEISGVVMSAGSAPQPVRRVVVSISGDALPTRSVVTDDTGKFVFSRLPVGSFAITARKAAYLPAEHGASKPGRTGSRVALAAGEKRAITLTIFRGGVIAGTLRDPSGQPVAGVVVGAIDTRLASQGASLSPETAMTDDRGNYRIFGLMPGEYAISAGPSPGGVGEIGARSLQEMDTLLSSLAQRQNRTAAPVSAPVIPPATPVAYAPIYYPGTPYYSEAAHFRLAAEEERAGVNFDVDHVPAASIEGVVSGDIANPASAQLALIPDGPRVSIGTAGITSVPPNATGRIQIRQPSSRPIPDRRTRPAQRDGCGVIVAAWCRHDERGRWPERSRSATRCESDDRQRAGVRRCGCRCERRGRQGRDRHDAERRNIRRQGGLRRRRRLQCRTTSPRCV